MKRLAVIGCSILMAFGLTACGGQKGQSSGAEVRTVSEGTETEKVAEETFAEPSKEAAATKAAGETDGSVDTKTAGETEKTSGTEAAPKTASEAQSQPEAAGPGKTLVVYYSATGHTEEVAGYLGAATDGQLFRLEPVNPYSSDDLNWRDENSRVTREHENPDQRVVELAASTVPDWESYETVFIGYPIWWGIAAWPVNMFIEANDFTGKTVIPFCTSASSGLGESGELLAEAAGTGEWLEGMRFRSGVSEEDVVAWVESLGLS